MAQNYIQQSPARNPARACSALRVPKWHGNVGFDLSSGEPNIRSYFFRGKRRVIENLGFMEKIKVRRMVSNA